MKNSDKTVVVRLLKNGITSNELLSLASKNNCIQIKNGISIPNINMYVNELFLLAKKLDERGISIQRLLQEKDTNIE